MFAMKFKESISEVPHGSIVGPILFSTCLKDFFHTIEKAYIHNFVEDKTSSVSAKTICEFVRSLKLEPETVIKRFSKNKMTFNPDKIYSNRNKQKQI